MSAGFGVKYAPVQGQGQTVVSDFSPGMAVHVVRVRVDEETGRVVPLNYFAIQDVGTAINPASVEGQMEGAAIQAVGWGLFEGIAWDEQGTPTTASLMDYAIPKASQAPPLATVLVNVPAEQGPYGAKGVGEPPVYPRRCGTGERRIPGVRRTSQAAADDLRPSPRRDGGDAESVEERHPRGPLVDGHTESVTATQGELNRHSQALG